MTEFEKTAQLLPICHSQAHWDLVLKMAKAIDLLIDKLQLDTNEPT